nr:methylamine utilization protein MauJ [Hyphomicrobium sp. 99]
MWIPYNWMASLRAESPPEAVSASEAAHELRNFVVGFFVRSTGARAWETDFLASSSPTVDQWVGERRVTIQFSSSQNGKMNEIVYNMLASGSKDALGIAYGAVQDFIDDVCLAHGRSIEVIGWRVADVEHGARWRSVPFLPSALSAIEPMRDVAPEFQSFIRLYREARCASSPMWRLVCAGAALAGLLQGDASGERSRNPISVEMLVRSGAYSFYPQFVDADAGTLSAWVEPRRQAVLADLGGAATTDQIEVSLTARREIESDAKLAALANLTDLVAREVLLSAMKGKEMSSEDIELEAVYPS